MDVQGWVETVSLIPVEPRGKKPLISWTEYQQRRASPEERAKWKKDFPGCNWGLVTGAVSGVIALDFDGDAGRSLRREKNVYGGPASITAKGFHTLHAYPDRPLKNGVRIVDGLDIRSDGGFVVVPPSIHPSGIKYQWEVSPWMVEPPPLPDWVWPLVEKAGETVANSATASSAHDGLPPGVGKGQRNAAAAREAGRLFAKGLYPGAIVAVLRAWNQKNCPPLPDTELFQVVRSIEKAEYRKNPPTPILNGADFLSGAIEMERTLVDPIIPDPARVILAGFAGMGKSSLALNLAAAVSAGRPFLGWETSRKHVLYIDGENPMNLVHKRTGIIFRALEGDLQSLHFHFPERKLDLGGPSGLSELEGMIGRVGAGMVVLDSFLNFYSLRSENDATETRKALDGLTYITRQTGCSVVILDHTGKPLREARGYGQAGPPTPRGTGAKVDFADVVLVLEEKRTEDRVLRNLYFTKLRGCPPMRAHVLEMDSRLVFRVVGEDAIVPVEMVRNLVANEPGIRTGEAVRRIIEDTHAHRRTVLRAIQRAEARGLVIRKGKPPSTRLFLPGNGDKTGGGGKTVTGQLIDFPGLFER